ncbi:deoxynucleoside kinase [Acidithiobacillus thiooxidans]|uniref:Deoxyguanosine kinase n=2 Tax=Acidithiobacillus thiooxidans TaxID=930 RepID=A0A1C2IYV7_ACITH|nr:MULTISPECIES: deoxynucleoside kinase [Acidithiobacillus]MBN2679274.1 deoxynucleoside kinase [Acidithiobacillaceae bacterium]MDD2751120.1 deoxynucleoside kinase [Acidithiobacillus sp.]MBE7565588.1 deoxynucleoside kinase [Acidithiobacillus sp. HP-11]MBU2751952.1 deoxynucleoside kinase [Acidithiobacillus thiooxidans]MBU2794040.1 deoxynucleoside kinase [Acidithiobacillus thiooxidans]
MNHPRIISIEGPIGAGKTSLARLLADHFQGEMILEKPEENPFLPGFYRQPGGELATELQFLLQRQAQWQTAALTNAYIISDYSARKDEIFTPLTLNAAEFQLFQQIKMQLHYQATPAALLIFLDAPLATLKERILSRARAYEQNLNADYLAKVQQAYRHWRSNYTAPCLEINTAELDFVHEERHNENLIKMVKYHLQDI